MHEPLNGIRDYQRSWPAFIHFPGVSAVINVLAGSALL